MYSDFCLKVNIFTPKTEIEIIKDENCVYRTKSITIAKTGTILDKSGKELSDVEIVKLYQMHGVNITSLFDGLYNLVVADRKIAKAFIFHDHAGGESRVFYTFDGNSIYIASSIKNILNASGDNHWYIDDYSVEEFIDKGYVSENRTLVMDIYKASHKKYTEFNLKSGYIADRNDCAVEYDKKDNLTAPKYDRIFDDAVLGCMHGKYAVNFAGDYDCAYTLYHASINEDENKKVNAYSYVADVSKKKDAYNAICRDMKNVQLHIGQINKDIVNFLPVIVYITEGIAFDANAFRDLEVAMRLKKDGVKNYISSDGVSGIYTKSFYNKLEKNIDDIVKKVTNIAGMLNKNRPKDSKANVDAADRLVNLSLAQSGMIMNYFDVRYTNPYMMKKFVKAAYKKVQADNPREFHTKTVEENLPGKASEIATKLQPKVDVLSLFLGSIDAKTISSIVRKSLYSKKFKRAYNDNRSKANYCLRIIYIELFETIFLGNNSKRFLDESRKFNYSLKAFFPSYFKKETE